MDIKPDERRELDVLRAWKERAVQLFGECDRGSIQCVAQGTGMLEAYEVNVIEWRRLREWMLGR
jgi:hypothetical protein